MRVWRTVALSTVGLLLSLTVAGIPAARAEASAETIYVAKTCGSTSDGSWQRPYCTIAAAAAVAQPGQTVYVRSGTYAEELTITRSGEPGRPITFRGHRGPSSSPATITPGRLKVGVTLAGVHDVVFAGFEFGAVDAPAVVADAARAVEVTEGGITAVRSAAVVVRGASAGVTVSRTRIQGGGAAAVSVEAGATGTVISGNSIVVAKPSLTITDAPDTVVTGNTLTPNCGPGVVVSGASPRLSVHNNIIDTAVRTSAGWTPCATPALALPLTVSADSTAGSEVDYNLVSPIYGGPLYSWGGTNYASPAEFRSATGQGAHDIFADPKLDARMLNNIGYLPGADSPAIDSGRADAPGALGYDIRSNAHADNPAVPNTGTGIGYVDRGAVEVSSMSVAPGTIARAAGGGTLDVVSDIGVTSAWVTDGPSGMISYRFDDGFQVVNRGGAAPHTFSRAGQHCVSIFVSQDSFRNGEGWQYSPCVVLGVGFNPVPPSPVLDTRAAVGVPTTTPVAANAEVVFQLGAVGGVPADKITAVTLNVTVTQPTKAGGLNVYPDGGSLPAFASVSFEAGRTVTAHATVTMYNGLIRVRNASAGTAHVVAEVTGFYAAGGVGLTTRTPVRVLDTLSAVGVPGTTPVPANGRLEANLGSWLPAGTTAAVVNVTAINATRDGQLTFYPPGGAVPAATHLSFSAGRAVGNMVILPVVNGKIAVAHTGTGTVHVQADLMGWFAPGASTFVPAGPLRIADTTQPGSVALAARTSLRVYPNQLHNQCLQDPPNCQRTAVVGTITVSRSTLAGHVVVYPTGGAVPIASTVSYAAGQTVTNEFTVATPAGSFEVYNGSKGTLHLTIDQAGWYLASPS